ncbi:S41 family peptidase [Cecembia sp.]|uniref:S41 family peptidase n=1 Tax=Cecembia sp. TaxID=1898110 RepID=UPI0025BBB9B1|nr:S41 family peptidase [Cecembia sp.]
MRRIKFSLFGILMSLVIFFPACNPETDDVAPIKVENVVKKAIFDSMREWYYWTNELPATLDLGQFSNNQEVLDQLRFRPLDRWSYLTTRAEFNAAFTGQASGAHGFSFSFDQDERLFVAFVFDSGPAGLDGWRRGWEFIEINGRPISSYRNSNGSYSFDLGPNTIGVQNTFKFRLPDGSETTRTIDKAAFQTNSVLHKDVYEIGGKKIGHWVYQSFRATQGLSPTRSQEVEDSFAYFESEGIDELIIDLRYNGGGSVAVTEQILNYLAPASASGRAMYTNRHNPNKFDNNRTVNFNKKGSLELDKIIFITSRSSASASELLINCLEPYMNLFLIGDNTFGKPVGSFPLSSFNRVLSENDVELVPITFAIANAEGRADYFDGFPVDIQVGDDPSRDWSDLNEMRLAAALDYVGNGSISARMINSYFKPVWEMIDAFEGLQKEFPMY